jgi:hypothetical protein
MRRRCTGRLTSTLAHKVRRYVNVLATGKKVTLFTAVANDLPTGGLWEPGGSVRPVHGCVR